jgi:predicted  nucleic acid-binding Zn-ribbon protein
MTTTRPPADLPGDAVDVCRLEYETLVTQVVTNRERLEKLELQVNQLAAELDSIRKLLHHRTAV